MTDTKKYLILSKLQIYTENGILKNAGVVIYDKKIHAIEAEKNLAKYQPADIVEFAENFHLVPGFIDLHVHGVNGSDVMDADSAALKNICHTLAKEGTTGFLATTMTAAPDAIEKALCSVRDFIQTQAEFPAAKILGVHLEGPFISPKKANAQSDSEILAPKIAYIERWQKLSANAIKLVTLAPELPGSLEFIRHLKQQNIIASMGHTNATYEEAQAAIDAGCSHATHLFNAMRSIHHRDPGVASAALLSEKVLAELIVDGVHLHPAIIRFALKLKGVEKIALVTDAMRAKCLQNGVYDLGGQAVTVKNNVASLENGTLAGSVLKMNSALRNILEYTNCSMSDAIKMTSENPARALGLFSQKGSIALQKDADLVVLDNNLNVALTLCGGSHVQ